MLNKTIRMSCVVLATTACLMACQGTSRNQPTIGAPVYITDQEIVSSVQHKIKHTSGIRSQAIMVSSKNGVVTLNGAVKDQRSVDVAEAAASSVPGVQAVKSNLVISK